jgi:hypothetical protein
MTIDGLYLQIISGTLDSVKIHVSGLAALVRSIGGIQALANYPYTMGLTIW